MVKRFVVVVVLYFLILTACDKGLSPPEFLPIGIDFPITPEGGNPVGNWLPDTINSVDVTILNKEKIPSFVDSLSLNTELDGTFTFAVTGVCSIQALLTIQPEVYIQGLSSPLIIPDIVDTLCGQGSYEIIEDRIFHLPLETNLFHLDTLGYTRSRSHLDLITLPNTFPYEGFGDINFFFVFHLQILN